MNRQSEVALEITDLCIDYKDIQRVSLMKNLLKREIKQSNVVHAIKNLSFSVNKGEILGIVGRNGSGKSTLLRSVAGIFQPDAGDIDLKGNRVALMAIGAGFNLNNTGRENIFKSGLLLGCAYEEIEKKCNDIIEFSELGSFIDRPVRTYSSGMYSKLSFAITAILETDIMLVDEVLSVGDSHFQDKSLRKMRELMESKDRTVLIVSHDLSILMELCTRVLWIHDGSKMGIGETKEIIHQYCEFMSVDTPRE